MESDILIKTIDLSRHYKVGEEEVIALDKVKTGPRARPRGPQQQRCRPSCCR